MGEARGSLDCGIYKSSHPIRNPAGAFHNPSVYIATKSHNHIPNPHGNPATTPHFCCFYILSPHLDVAFSCIIQPHNPAGGGHNPTHRYNPTKTKPMSHTNPSQPHNFATLTPSSHSLISAAASTILPICSSLSLYSLYLYYH